MSWRNVMTGLRGGGSLPTSVGGASQPSRTASASSASTRSGLRPGRGGTISATTRSRSVTSTVSPPAARRTYSLSLFLRSFRPTERIMAGSYRKLHCQCLNLASLLAMFSGSRAEDEAANWAHRRLPEKNKLNAADAEQVEAAFRTKLLGFAVAQADTVPEPKKRMRLRPAPPICGATKERLV
jgi:hypothetical protein